MQGLATLPISDPGLNGSLGRYSLDCLEAVHIPDRVDDRGGRVHPAAATQIRP